MNLCKLKVYANNDQAVLVWKYENMIPNCLGFAIFRRAANDSISTGFPLPNKVGFEGEDHTLGIEKPTTEWPIQRFMWTDFNVNKGDKIQYKIVPMILTTESVNNATFKLEMDSINTSIWSEFISIETGKGVQAYFNRGLISSQFFNLMRTKFANELSGTSVKEIISGKANKVRDFLGGYLSEKLFEILQEVLDNKNVSIYGALYELQQNDLLEKLKLIGKRAHIVLANGSFKTKGEDRNAIAREQLRQAGVEVFDRIVSPNHFGHNKFLVIVDGDKKNVWTGSTNWTAGGLFSQVNNGLYFVNNLPIADAYLSEYNTLIKAGSSSIDEKLLTSNDLPQPNNKFPHIWFSPKNQSGDLNEVTQLLKSAKKGVLFLMFNPGPKGTLFNSILDLQQEKPDLYIHGVINQDPGGNTPLIFFKSGVQDKANWSDILPDRIKQDIGFFRSEQSGGLVTIHSKVIVIDPFTDHGTVITGSNNFGPKASLRNDDNLIIVQDKKLVEEYAVNILAVYDHYRWRYSISKINSNFKGLTKDPLWMSHYLKSEKGKELESFWFKE